MNYLTSLLFKPKIPVICIRQNITLGVFHSINRQINKLSNLRAIAIVIDSQKGLPVQTQMLANSIKRLAKKHNIPIYCFAETRCTGQPYSLMTIANKSYCLPSSIIGLYRNIDWFGIKDLLKQKKIETRSWFSYKNSVLGRLFCTEDVNKQDIINRLQQIQKDSVNSFAKKHTVDCNQKILQSQSKRIQLPNQYLIGREAVQKGLVGSIGNFYSILDKQFPNTKLKYIEHSTILKGYLGVGLALPFVLICLLLGTKTLIKYTTILSFYLFYKKKANNNRNKQKRQRQVDSKI